MRMSLLAFAFLATTLTFQSLNADELPRRSAELQVLDRYVGTWDFAVTNKPVGGATITGKTSETRRWTLGNKFVHFENSKMEDSKEPEFQMLVTYDPATKTYPGVLMSGSSRALVDGTWDQSKQTMTFRGMFTDGSGTTFVYSNHFVDHDHCETSGVFKDAAGKVLFEQIQKQTRSK